MTQNNGKTTRSIMNRYIGIEASSVPKTEAASITLRLEDAEEYIRMNSGSAQTVTVPPDSDVPFEIGTEIALEQSGAGTLTVVAGSGVTINPPAGVTLVLNGQYATAALKKVGTNIWTIAGRLV